MDAKEYLRKVEILDHRIEARSQQRDEIRERFVSVSASVYDVDRVQTSPKQDTWTLSVDKLADLDQEIERMIREYARAKDLIISQICDMEDGRYIRILHKRYIQYKTLGTIADEMGYSEDRIKHLHGEALDAFREKYLEGEKHE